MSATVEKLIQPLPWHVGPHDGVMTDRGVFDANDVLVFGNVTQDEAEFIVARCNAPAVSTADLMVCAAVPLLNAAPDLLAALKWADKQLRALVTEDDGSGVFIRGTGTELGGFGEGVDAMRAAIKKAEGR